MEIKMSWDKLHQSMSKLSKCHSNYPWLNPKKSLALHLRTHDSLWVTLKWLFSPLINKGCLWHMYSNCYILTNYYRKRFIFFRSTFVIRSPTSFLYIKHNCTFIYNSLMGSFWMKIEQVDLDPYPLQAYQVTREHEYHFLS